MADNEADGSKGSLRQNPSSKKRRDPPIIDATATEISTAPDAADETAAPPDPAPLTLGEAPSPDRKSGETEADEPVLFGQVRRGPAPATPENASDPAAAGSEAAAPDESLAAGPRAESSAPFTATPATPAGETALGDNLGRGMFGDPPTSFGAEPPEPPRPEPPRRSSAATILSGLAVLLLAIIAGLLFAGPQHGGEDMKAALEAANTRLAALEARPDAAPLASRVAEVDEHTKTVEAEFAGLRKTADDLTRRVDAMTAAADAAKAAPPEPAVSPPPAPSAEPATPAPPAVAAADVEALSDRLNDLSRKVDGLPTETPPAVDLTPLQAKIADLGDRFAELRASVAALPRIDLGPTEKRVDEVSQRIGDVDHGLSALAAAVAALPKVDLGPLKAGLVANEQRIAPLEAALSAPKNDDRVTEVRSVGSGDMSRAAPLAVVAQEIARGIDEGRPITAEVEALRALGVEDAALTPLAAIAAKGAPTPSGLKAGWAAVEPDVIAATATRQAGGSLIDRFTAKALQIVTVRRIGDAVGEDPTSVASRVSARLDAGDVGAALAEWEKLPDAGRDVSRAWADAARSRLDAQGAAHGLASSAIETLAKAKG